MNNRVLTIHASSLDNAADCERRMFANSYPALLKNAGYEVREQVRYITANVGSGIHAGADYLNKIYIDSGVLPSAMDLQPAIDQAYDKFLALVVKDAEQYEVRYPKTNFPDNDAVYTHIVEYVTLYLNEVLPTRKLDLTEQHFHIKLRPDVEIKSTLDGYGQETLFDLKTGRKITPAYYQIGTYVYLLRNAGYIVKSAQLDYITKKRDNDPAQHVIIKYDPDACMTMAQFGMAKLIGSWEAFNVAQDINVLTINPRSEGCNAFFCPLYGTKSCPIGN